jgi:hypothetical protein
MTTANPERGEQVRPAGRYGGAVSQPPRERLVLVHGAGRAGRVWRKTAWHTATLALKHGPDSYGRQQWGILHNGGNSDAATPRER